MSRLRLSDVKPGDMVMCDDGFPCMPPGRRRVEVSAHGLFVRCNEGHHYLSGQVGDDGLLIGIYGAGELADTAAEIEIAGEIPAGIMPLDPGKGLPDDAAEFLRAYPCGDVVRHVDGRNGQVIAHFDLDPHVPAVEERRLAVLVFAPRVDGAMDVARFLWPEEHVRPCRMGPAGRAEFIGRLHAAIKDAMGEAMAEAQATSDPPADDGWRWYAGGFEDAEVWEGPFSTREKAIAAGLLVYPDGVYVAEGRNPPVLLSDYAPIDRFRELCDEALLDSDRVSYEFDDDYAFDCTPVQDKDLQERLRRACDDWQQAHGLVFTVRTIAEMRGGEYVPGEARSEGRSDV